MIGVSVALGIECWRVFNQIKELQGGIFFFTSSPVLGSVSVV
jgi:hypothetical protein